MIAVSHLTPIGTRVKHLNTDDLGDLLGFDSEGLARVEFDIDPDGREEHLDPASLIEWPI